MPRCALCVDRRARTGIHRIMQMTSNSFGARTFHMGASNVGLGAILVQWQDSIEHAIAYANELG